MSDNEKVQCCNPECKEWRYLYSEVTMFPWGAVYCKGACADRAREFRSQITTGTAHALAKVRKDFVRRRV